MARGPGGEFDPQRYAERMEQRASQRDEMILAELRSLGDSFSLLFQRVEGLQADVRRHGVSQGEFSQRLNEFELQIGEARDLVHKTRAEISSHITAETEAAAKGAAQGAAQGTAHIAPAIKEAVARISPKMSRPQWVALLMIGAVFLTNFVEKAPAVFRAINAFFLGVMGLDQK